MNERPRRVLLVIRHAVGGIRTFLRYVFGGLDPARYQLMIVTVRGDEVGTLIQDLERFKPELRLVDRDHALARLALETIRAARSWRPDVIHSHGFTAGVAATPAAMLTGARHLITSHNVFAPDDFVGLKGAAKRALLTAVLNRASLIHLVGTGAEENTVEFLPRIDRRRLRVLRNGVARPPTMDAGVAMKWRNEVSPDGRVLFGFFGRFMPEKGFEVLIEAVEALRGRGLGARFRVVAVNDGSYVREYRALIGRREMTENFEFLGFSPDAVRLMSCVDAVVMPSLREACPLVAMEAMAAGAPFISTTIPAVRELANGSPSLLVPPGDPASLANAMAEVIENPAARKSAALAYAPKAADAFDIRVTIDGLERLYDELCS